MSDVATTKPMPNAVTPRGHRPRSTASLPIAELLLPVVRSGVTGILLITAPPGGGKTTALENLRGIVPIDASVGFFDADQAAEARRESASRLVLLAASEPPPNTRFVNVFTVSPWTLDDCMEYLAARHRPRCKSVLERLGRDPSFSILDGSPQLLSLVIDAMAADESLQSSREILREHLRQIIPPGLARDRLILDGASFAPLGTELLRWWRHDAIQKICIADWIAEQLCGDTIPKQLKAVVEKESVQEIAAAVRSQPRAIDCLHRLIATQPCSEALPMAASILLANDPDWRPSSARQLNLTKARLSGARWSGIDLTGATLMCAELSGADLSEANLGDVDARGANLGGASLRSARLYQTNLVAANLMSADLSEASAVKADLSEATLESANLRKAVFDQARFTRTNLSRTNAAHADFSRVRFAGANFRQADFAHARFIGAILDNADMSEASWNSTCFAKATLRFCNLEWLEIEDADFDDADLTGSLLTGTKIHGGRFRNTNLTRTGLAEIDWTDASLHGANLTDASFHMGSTRSGLVGSTIAGEGSRTGFYTDDSKDQFYKPPEEIRKACLCGANLLGAIVERTDFYLVDLRRAVYSNAQALHFEKSGAILEE